MHSNEFYKFKLCLGPDVLTLPIYGLHMSRFITTHVRHKTINRRVKIVSSNVFKECQKHTPIEGLGDTKNMMRKQDVYCNLVIVNFVIELNKKKV